MRTDQCDRSGRLVCLGHALDADARRPQIVEKSQGYGPPKLRTRFKRRACVSMETAFVVTSCQRSELACRKRLTAGG